MDCIEPIELIELSDDTAERDAALAAIHWIVAAIGPRGIATKVIALRFLMRLESRSMEAAGKEYGVTRAAISKCLTNFATSFGMKSYRSEQTRAVYAARQRKVWEKRKAAAKQQAL